MGPPHKGSPSRLLSHLKEEPIFTSEASFSPWVTLRCENYMQKSFQPLRLQLQCCEVDKGIDYKDKMVKIVPKTQLGNSIR